MLQTMPELRENLWKVVNALQTGLKERGFNIGPSGSPVTPVILEGGVAEATNVVYDMRENYGIFCSMVVYPVIPKGMILLRLIPTADHTLEDVKLTLDVFTEVAQKLKDGKYSKENLAKVEVED